jgi:hypothetical protein
MMLKLKNASLSLGRGILLAVMVNLFTAHATDQNNEGRGLWDRVANIEHTLSEAREEIDHTIKSVVTRISESIPISNSLKIKVLYGSMAVFGVACVACDISKFFYLPNCPEPMHIDLVHRLTRGDIGGGYPIIDYEGSSADLWPYTHTHTYTHTPYTHLPPELNGLSIIGHRQSF